MLKICNPESLHGMKIPYKICFPFSGSGSSAIQGNPKDWPHITLCRIFMYRTSLMWYTYSDHHFAIFAYTILYRQCCPFFSYISAGLHAWMKFVFFFYFNVYLQNFPNPCKISSLSMPSLGPESMKHHVPSSSQTMKTRFLLKNKEILTQLPFKINENLLMSIF